MEFMTALKSGGYVIVFRHGATDESQKDIFPFNFEDMSAQRQLNDKGRNTARDIGASLAKLGVPIGDVYTSRLNRAVASDRRPPDGAQESLFDCNVRFEIDGVSLRYSSARSQ
jgi:bisphosphoglycerate-dependent phosphoglycerate mutase